MPFQVWNALPEDELFRTEQAVEMSEATRQPALMGRIQRVVSGALVPTPVAAGASHSIPNLLLQWKELKTPLAAQSFEKPATQMIAHDNPPLDPHYQRLSEHFSTRQF